MNNAASELVYEYDRVKDQSKDNVPLTIRFRVVVGAPVIGAFGRLFSGPKRDKESERRSGCIQFKYSLEVLRELALGGHADGELLGLTAPVHMISILLTLEKRNNILSIAGALLVVMIHMPRWRAIGFAP